MKRPISLLFAVSLALQAGAAFAQSYEEAVLAQLRQEGYAQITMTTTMLGRIRFVAIGAKGQREIVLNPRTGEVLRDVWFVDSSNSGNSGSGKSAGSKSVASDDAGDDDSEDDNGSSSGGNSGSDDRGGNSGSDDSGGGGDSGGDSGGGDDSRDDDSGDDDSGGDDSGGDDSGGDRGKDDD